MPINTKFYTIGYEGLSLDAFLALLKENQIERLIDVRANAISRKKGFAKNALKEALEEQGIEYIHVPEVGIPSDVRKAWKNRDALLTYYQATLLERKDLQRAVSRVVRLCREKNSALMCFEKDYKSCHRRSLSVFIHWYYHTLTGFNIYADGTVKDLHDRIGCKPEDYLPISDERWEEQIQDGQTDAYTEEEE